MLRLECLVVIHLECPAIAFEGGFYKFKLRILDGLEFLVGNFMLWYSNLGILFLQNVVSYEVFLQCFVAYSWSIEI